MFEATASLKPMFQVRRFWGSAGECSCWVGAAPEPQPCSAPLTATTSSSRGKIHTTCSSQISTWLFNPYSSASVLQGKPSTSGFFSHPESCHFWQQNHIAEGFFLGFVDCFSSLRILARKNFQQSEREWSSDITFVPFPGRVAGSQFSEFFSEANWFMFVSSPSILVRSCQRAAKIASPTDERPLSFNHMQNQGSATEQTALPKIQIAPRSSPTISHCCKSAWLISSASHPNDTDGLSAAPGPIQQGQGSSGELHSECRVMVEKPPHKILSKSCFKPGLKVSCDQHSQLSTFIPSQWQEPGKLSDWMGMKEQNGEHHNLALHLRNQLVLDTERNGTTF